jgi:AraC-like DNA-binding protein
MWARYFEPLKLDELAASVFVSPFHFLRVFTKTTGITPGKYLSAIRMYEAKRLLLTSSLRVSDIVYNVGYRSLGTFTTRFTQMVGMTPSQYREPTVGELFLAVGPRFSRIPSADAVRGVPAVTDPQPGGASVTGGIELPEETAPAEVLICVFRELVPQCAPVAHQFLTDSGSGRFAIHDLPAGQYTVIAVAEPPAGTGGPILFDAQPVLATPGGTALVNLRLRRPRPTDPPFAISLATRAALSTERIVVARQRGSRAAAA